jgi:hypothetical protein
MAFKRDCQKLEGWDIFNTNLKNCNNPEKDYLIFIHDLKHFFPFFKKEYFLKNFIIFKNPQVFDSPIQNLLKTYFNIDLDNYY